MRAVEDALLLAPLPWVEMVLTMRQPVTGSADADTEALADIYAGIILSANDVVVGLARLCILNDFHLRADERVRRFPDDPHSAAEAERLRMDGAAAADAMAIFIHVAQAVDRRRKAATKTPDADPVPDPQAPDSPESGNPLEGN